MTRFLLDTNIPSELTRPVPEPRLVQWLDAADDETLFLSVISLAEIRKGLRTMEPGQRRTGIVEWVDGVLLPWFDSRILPVTKSIAERWGDVAGAAQLQGVAVGMADGLIAVTALEMDLVVVTRNTRHFEGLGVRVCNPWLGS